MLKTALAVALRSLDFQRDRRCQLHDIEISDWPELLKLTDQSQITLPLGVRCREYLPDSIRARMDRNLSDNRVRHQRLLNEYRLVANALRERDVEHIVLKGLAQIAPFYVSDSCHRPQYDIDLYCPSDSLERAVDALKNAGFKPVYPHQKRADHLPAMMRNQHSEWKGDYYAPDLPLTVELHFRFWDADTERISASQVENFWQRRTTCTVQGITIPMLSLSDGVSYSALHLMRHLLRGDLRVYHVYELAHFLNQTSNDDRLWEEWLHHRGGHAPVIESVAFRLAAAWFGCKLHSSIQEGIERLPPAIARWFGLFSHSPLLTEQPNKDELFLHMNLVDNRFDRVSILARRLLPLRSPRAIAPPLESGRISLRRIYSAMRRQSAFLIRRVTHHVRTMAALIPSLVRWKVLSRKYAAY